MLEQSGKYRIDSILGKGAMGVVYKAFDPFTGHIVALKTIRMEQFADGVRDDLISRFRNEALAAGRLHHPNIVTVYDYDYDYDYDGHAESAYIAMEFVEGTPLNTLMAPDTPIALPRVKAWMNDLLLALEHAHSRGVIHRDIKPANLLITSNDEVKVSDFGIARIESSAPTPSGAMIGTPSYMSPEQFRGETADGRSDVFSAGVVLYQLLTGARPFVGSSSAVMHQILYAHPAAPSTLLPMLGTGFDAIVARALAKAPQDRFASARAFLKALARVDQTGPDPDATMLAGSERTVLAAGLRPSHARKNGDGGALAPWQLAVFPELEPLLAHQIGPMGRLLLTQLAGRADGVVELGNLLLAHIPSELGRMQFRENVRQLKEKLDAGAP